jgi:thymidylate kinase
MKVYRSKFLSALFQALERDAVPYCVLRNYDNIYEDTSSDIDLAVEPEDIARLSNSLAEAAKSSGFRFVHRARYINYSFVYWHEAAGFIRVDFETEVRWRIFPVLTAKSVIGLRRKKGEFYIPHARHESVILFVAAIWRGQISSRYREQLARLYEQVGNRTELERTFQATLGSYGQKFLAWQERILTEDPAPGIWKAAKRSIGRNAFRDPPTRRALWRYLSQDLYRLRERILHPAGISLLYVSSGTASGQMEELLKRMEFLYPIKKSVMHVFTHAAQTPNRAGSRLKLQRLQTLFKGGLFVRFFQVADDQIGRVLSTRARYLFPSRSFVAAETPCFGICLTHVTTGFMAELTPAQSPIDPIDGVIQFISRILEQRRIRSKQRPERRGAFVVLVGLDGSGKTTVARKICCQVSHSAAFKLVRYFHWVPGIASQASLPLPDLAQTERKIPQKKTRMRSLLSSARLLKNVVSANLGYWFRTRPLRRRGALVLVDRYYYNYFLDPVSVKYYGPEWLLKKAQDFLPRPDLVVILKAPAQTILARKQELTPEEAERQIQLLDRLQYQARQVFEVDATQPPDRVAEIILEKLSSQTVARTMSQNTLEN